MRRIELLLVFKWAKMGAQVRCVGFGLERRNRHMEVCHLLTGTPLCALKDSFWCDRIFNIRPCHTSRRAVHKRGMPLILMVLTSMIRMKSKWVAKISYTNDRCAFALTTKTRPAPTLIHRTYTHTQSSIAFFYGCRNHYWAAQHRAHTT